MIRFCTHFAPLSYQYFDDPLIDIDISQRLPIDIDIFQNCLNDIDIDIDIFQNCLINIFKNDHIDIDIFQKCRYIDNRYSISIYRTGLPLHVGPTVLGPNKIFAMQCGLSPDVWIVCYKLFTVRTPISQI